jgi:thioredoxin-like negative regulator of GroEL
MALGQAMQILPVVMFLLCGLTSIAVAQTRYPPNEMPMYGGIEKTPAMKEADAQFIAEAIKIGGTRQAAAAQLADRGFAAFMAGDYRGAMRRLNQAWLLDNQQAGAYHGFALVVLSRDNDIAGATAMFTQAVGLPSARPGTFGDFGRFLMMTKRPAEARPILERGRAMDAENADIAALLTLAYLDTGANEQGCTLGQTVVTRAPRGVREEIERRLAGPACAKSPPSAPSQTEPQPQR